VSGTALGLALAAAIVHALWNVLVGGARDPRPAAAVAMLAGVVVAAPAAIVFWDVRAAAVPWIAASAVLELAYVVLLAAAYRRASVGVIYPIARGAAAPLVLAAAVVVGVSTSAAYTLVDKRGLEHASPVPYLEAVMVGPALVYGLYAARGAGWPALRAAAGRTSLLAGFCMFGAYALVLAALERAAAAPVAAVRESSIVMAPLLAALLLRHPIGRRGLLGAMVVAAGVALVALA
jgi:drug/metabolite transporter (DMT)-like permease